MVILAGCCPSFLTVGGDVAEDTSGPLVRTCATSISMTEASLSTCENRLLPASAASSVVITLCFLWNSEFGN